MRIENEVQLDFCDVLIKPKRSESPSRKAVNLSTQYKFLNSKKEWNGVPIISANMSTTGSIAIAKELSKKHAMTALHKHYSIDKLIKHFITENRFYTWYSTGIKDHDIGKLKECLVKLKSYNLTIPFINVDVANGYTNYFVDKIKQIRKLAPESTIMAGNVCTGEMVHELLLAGADVIKIGIGPGSVCTTRIQTGVGFPQLSAIISCADTAHGLRGHICADGGCTTPGDVAKAFGAGADFVMLGGMFSGTLECEGDWTYDKDGNKESMVFYGMSSKDAMKKFGGWENYKTSEGKTVTVPNRGPVEEVLQEIMGGLRSACTYVGTEELKYFSKCCTFIRVNRTHNTIYS